MSIVDQINLKNRLATAKFIAETKEVLEEKDTNQISELVGVKGIGEGTIAKLNELGIKNRTQLLKVEDDFIKLNFSPLAQRAIRNFIEDNKKIVGL